MRKLMIAAAFGAALLTGITTKAMAQSNSQAPAMSPEFIQAADETAAAVKADPENANKALKNLFKKRKKEDLLALGYYYKEKGNIDLAQSTVEELYHDAGTYVPGLMLYGDIMYAKKDYGKAGEKYDEAIYQDPELKEAYLKKAEVYKHVSPETAEGPLLEVLNIDTAYLPAMRELASVYYAENKIDEATETYKKYFELEKNPDVASLKEYAVLLFIDKKYEESLAQVEQVLPKDPKDISLNRMKYYDNIELKNWDAAQAQEPQFFGQYNDTLYNFSDYQYRARLASHNRKYSDAISDLQKAIELKKDKPELYKDLSTAYRRAGQLDNALDSYKTYIKQLGGEQIPVQELYQLGHLYYVAASNMVDDKDTKYQSNPKFLGYVASGDTLFAQLATRSESYMGPFWRARINSLKDPNTADENVKNLYDEAYTRLQKAGGDDNKDNIVECLRYTAFYWMQKEDNAQAKVYCNKILEINPGDRLATQILQVLK